MKKNLDAPLSLEMSNAWDDHPFIQLLSSYGRYVLFTVLALLVLLTLVYRLTSGGSAKAEKDYFNADNEFQLFAQPIVEEADSAASREALNRLEQIMQRRPELNAKYDGLVAQILIFRGDADSAAPFAARAIARTAAENHPFYTDYAQTTLLIGSEQYQEALNRAQELQQKMTATMLQTQKNVHSASGDSLQDSEYPPFGDSLYAYNLIRIGMLQQQLGLSAEEGNTWQEWKNLIQEKDGVLPAGRISSATIEQQLGHFTDNKLSLLDYIEAREKTLQALQALQ